MKAIGMLAMSGAFALLTSCGEPSVGVDNEVAAELRALRAVLVQQQRGAGTAGAPIPTATDRTQITTALQPLREVLDGLVQSQRELQTRQLALTQELQRWSQLLVETAKGAQHEEAQAMVQRLQQLEKTLQEQDTRHRQVEALMQGALDRTADRLEDFLRRLEGSLPPGSGQPPNPGSTTPSRREAEPAPGGGTSEPRPPAGGQTPPASGGGEDHGSNGAQGGTAMARRSSRTLWWMLPAVLAASLGAAFFLRLRRQSHRPAASSGGANAGAMEFPREPGIDRGVEEIWAAAALLGEAVGRLKQTAAAEANPGQPAAVAGAEDGVDLSEVVVLDDELVNGIAPSAPSVALAPAPTPAPARPRPEPAPALTAVRCRLAGSTGRTQAEVLHVLADDPRVLRRPEPVVTATATALEVAFHVLPGLPASERSQIEQRLRDALG